MFMISCEKLELRWNLPRSNQNDLARNINSNGRDWPLARFSVTKSEVAVGESIQFNSLSTGNPDNFEWRFIGGSPSSSIKSEESVSYNNIGAFDVFLKVKNNFGLDSILKTKVVKTYYLKNFSNFSLDGWSGNNWFFSTSPTCPGCIYAWENTSGSASVFQLSKSFNTYSELNDLEFYYNIFSPGGTLRVLINGIEIWSDSGYGSDTVKLNLPTLKSFNITFQAEVGYTQTIYLNNIKIKAR